ncbi:MAG: hypothetical protein LBS21_13270 [Clostridiales bacterium]|jgi:hypothetical protein|nr:hypothetical protein [Clostridiales bacterium]
MMRKDIVILMSFVILFIIGFYFIANSGNANDTKLPEEIEIYDFVAEPYFEIDGRSITFEDIPENIAEMAVAYEFLYTITGETDKKAHILADSETHRLILNNEKKQIEEELFMQKFIIHKSTVLTEDQYGREYAPELGTYTNSLIYDGWRECVEKFGLTEFEIINAEFSQCYSPKALERSPQHGNGFHRRSFIVGKNAKDDAYKIYDFGLM